MFEIRVICAPQDTERVVAALDSTFTTGTVTVYPTRDSKRNRLYLRADHLTAQDTPADTADWPTPETAYDSAPSIVSEIGWTARTARAVASGTFPDREFWLRKAALLDRIALSGENDGTPAAADLATQAARTLMDLDEEPVICDPRHYVRRQYTRWTKNQ